MTGEKTLSNDELESRWPAIRRVLDTDGATASCAEIGSESDGVYRDQLFQFAIRKLGGGAGASTGDLDAMVTIGDAAIANALETADRMSGAADLWRDRANVIAYNVSANLCDCWGDGDSRQARHFEAGLRFADQALEFRRMLKKGPGPSSMAYWARGKHLLSLGRVGEAVDTFRESLGCEESMTRESGGDPAALDAAPGGLLNARAFVGLALMRSGQRGGGPMLEEALAVLRRRATHGQGEMKDDAQVYLSQVEEAVRRN